jgi:RNA-binding protein YlmH
MGSLYNLNLDKSLFGDIVITNNKYYFYVLGIIADEIERSFNKVGRFNIEIERVNLDVLSNYEREYESIELIVSSLRIDTVISKIINSNRSKVKDLISDKDVMLNYNYLKNNSYYLHPGDIFSIRRFGKYKFIDIKKNTKSGNLIIEIYKYI